jgi:hypothetical protein
MVNLDAELLGSHGQHLGDGAMSQDAIAAIADQANGDAFGHFELSGANEALKAHVLSASERRMATHGLDLKRGGRLAAALMLALLGALAQAEQLRVHKTYYDAKSLFAATQQLSADLGRPPSAAEWPEILLDAPPTGEVWRGPYIGGMRRDGWNNPYRFRSDVAGPGMFGIYSVGVNGIDEGGEGDDVSSWQGYHPRFYPETRGTALDWLFVSLPVLFGGMVLLLGRYVFLAWRRWQGSKAAR